MHMYEKKERKGRENALVLIPRMTPIPKPLAMPARRLLRAHGISPMCLRSSTGEILFLERYACS